MFDADIEGNPFVMPHDSKVLTRQILNKKEEKQRDRSLRRRKQNLKIWEKGTKLNRVGALRRIEDIELPEVSAEPKKLTMAEVAHAADQAMANDRVHMKENVSRLVDKKREMFRIQMMIDLKEDETAKFVKFAEVRDKGLKKSEDMLNEDIEHLQKFWEKCKRDSHNAMKEAEDASKKKMKKQLKLNRINDEITGVMTNIQKHEEAMADCAKYKHFLDKLSTIPEEDARLSFDDPSQFMELFANLVEENLFLIQITQEQEQEIEATKNEIMHLEKGMNQQMTSLKEAHGSVLKAIDEKTKRCSVLEQRLKESHDNEQKELPALKKIEEVVGRIYIGSESEEGQQSCLSMLGEIETSIHNYLRIFDEVREIDQSTVYDLAKKRKEARRDEYRERAILNEKIKTEERALKYKQRSENPKARAVGKQIMRKYRPKEKQVRAKVVEINQDEQDLREYLE
jgi:hypothetical protein